ncbi:MAG: nucleotidyltransferase domain-containing protein [bacterium]|nr:nucleotidyltransferase domain-containing protein [bacterium]
MVSEETLAKVAKRLVAGFHPQRIILFGSQARGTADSRSDMDILVVYSFKGDRGDIMLAMDKALKGLKMARDIIVLTPEEFEIDRQIPGTIARPAWREGRILYEHS